MRTRSIPLFCAILFLLIVSAGTLFAQSIYPVVTLLHTPGSSIYTYHVSVPADNSYPFGQLLLFTQATSWNGFQETWTASGAVVNGVDQGWATQFNWGDLGDTVEWRANSGQEAISSWEGDFILDAPGTIPVLGSGWTKDGVANSVHEFAIDVPGYMVPIPEPSSLLALGSLVGLMVPALRRRIRQI